MPEQSQSDAYSSVERQVRVQQEVITSIDRKWHSKDNQKKHEKCNATSIIVLALALAISNKFYYSKSKV